MKVSQVEKYLIDELVGSGIEQPEAQSMARILLAHRLGISLPQLPLHRDDPMEAEELAGQLQQLQAGEPLQYLIGETEFMGLTLSCTPSALIPRGDSEVAAERAVQLMAANPAPLIADICTGCGAYALALAHHLPQAQLWAVDISPEALALAERNAQQLQLSGRITFLSGDLLSPLLDRGVSLDLIVSNPPYIPSVELPYLPAQVRREPAIALDGGADGLYFYRRLAADSGKILKRDGWLLVEHGCDQAEDIAHIMEEADFRLSEVIKDYGGHQRGSLFQWLGQAVKETAHGD